MRKQIIVGLAAAAACWAPGGAQDTEEGDRPRVSVARFDEDGRLLYPADIESWVHVGSNLGLNYRQVDFDPDSPGTFGVVTMEPTAYRIFMETGAFPDGTMLHLVFHRVVRDKELSPDGFATGPALAEEIHYKDAEKFPDGFNFYNFTPGQERAEAVPLPNDCVTCHKASADHDGVFTQFYPKLRARLEE